MAYLNLGILAHVDAGKTSLTERLLYAAGVIDELGSVDAGSTQTDSLELERRRGITIASAVASFAVGPITVNLIDTPGHPDFIAEVERALAVLDGAVLVVSAVEGVQAQTRLLMRTLRRLQIPTVIFVNKIDRAGARAGGVLRELESTLGLRTAPMVRVTALGTRAAGVSPVGAAELLETITRHDDRLLRRYVEDGSVPEPAVRSRVRQLSRAGTISCVFLGSAITGAGVPELTAALPKLLPRAGGDPHDDLSARVFKIDRRDGVRRTYLRMIDGTLQVRSTVPLARSETKINSLARFDGSALIAVDRLEAGQIGVVRGPVRSRIGDWVGRTRTDGGVGLPPPSWETVVAPTDPSRSGELFAALSEIADGDPLIMVRRHAERGEITVSLYGEVQKEVIESTLSTAYGLGVVFAETATVHVERLVHSGSAVELMGDPANPFLATVGLRLEPAAVGAGVSFHLEVERGSMPAAFFTAVEDTARLALGQGLAGWPIPDARVIMTHSGYAPRQSHAHARFDKSMSSTGSDFRFVTALVVAEAVRTAGTVVCEPVHRVRIEVPADCLTAVLNLTARTGSVDAPQLDGPLAVVAGEVPAARLTALGRQLPGLTRGEGLLESRLVRFDPVRGADPPRRDRLQPDPLDRRTYLLATAGRAPE